MVILLDCNDLLLLIRFSILLPTSLAIGKGERGSVRGWGDPNDEIEFDFTNLSAGDLVTILLLDWFLLGFLYIELALLIGLS